MASIQLSLVVLFLIKAKIFLQSEKDIIRNGFEVQYTEVVVSDCLKFLPILSLIFRLWQQSSKVVCVICRKQSRSNCNF